MCERALPLRSGRCEISHQLIARIGAKALAVPQFGWRPPARLDAGHVGQFIVNFLDMLRSGRDAEDEAALNILRSVDDALETLTRQPQADEAAREVHWYHLWRQPPRHTPPEKDDWYIPGEVSPEAALVYFEMHEGFSGGLLFCDDFDLAAEFILEKRELLRTPRGNSSGLRAGRSLKKFHVKRRS